MNCVKRFCFVARQMRHLGCYHLQASAFKAGVNLTDDVFGKASGLMMEKCVR